MTNSKDAYSEYDQFGIDRPHPAVLRITLNRPAAMNALTDAGHRQLSKIWIDAGADETVRAILLRGEGRHFSVGGDFALVEAMIEDPEQCARTMQEARDLVWNLIDCPKPIVSAMQGAAVGGALAAGLLADVAIAATDAKLLDGHIRLGVAAGDHAVLVWPLLCGIARAKYHLLLNEPVSGERAEQIGMVALAVEEAELQETALAVALRLAEGPREALRATKQALNDWLRAAGPAFEASWQAERAGFASADAREGLISFAERRRPTFG